MVPLSALVILGTVGVFSTGTFIFAIYYTTKTRLEARRLKQDGADTDMSLPLTESAAGLGIMSRTPTPLPPAPPPPRPVTPEAADPPPLSGKYDLQENDSTINMSSRAEPSPEFLPATTYRAKTPPPTRLSPMVFRPPTPEAEYPPPLPQDFRSRSVSPLPPHSPLLPPPPSLPPSSSDRSRGRNPPVGFPPTKRDKPRDREAERPDIMHEIYDIYCKLPPTPKFVPKSAPATVTSFAQADSKWAYFGQKRAESRNREPDEGRERVMNMV